jgi:hypothetical protein
MPTFSITAAARRPHDGDELARIDLDIHRIEGGGFDFVSPEGLRQVLKLQHFLFPYAFDLSADLEAVFVQECGVRRGHDLLAGL